jgi:hypothetical protein
VIVLKCKRTRSLVRNKIQKTFKNEKKIMIVRKLIVVIFVFIKFTETFHLEPIDFVNVESFDGVRSYPVFKVSFSPEDADKVVRVKMDEDMIKIMDKQNQNNAKLTHPKSGKLINSAELDGKTTRKLMPTKSQTVLGKVKNVNVDKVRDFVPMSRQDIKNLKKLSFHGRSPPSNISTISSTSTSTSTISPQITTQSNKPRPTQIDFNHRKYKNQQKIKPTKIKPSLAPVKDRKRAASTKVETKVVKRMPHAVENEPRFPKNIDKGFLPLMRPSPINVPSPSAPSFHTMRNYVDYLKQRQKIFFDALEKDEEILDGDKLARNVEGKSRDVETEIDYFLKRERELAEEQRPKETTKASTRNDDESSTERIKTDTTSSSEEESVEVESSDNDGDEEETKKLEKFVPFRMYAQVRHVEAENHKPKHQADDPKVKEKLTLEKKNVYYKEEGYDEKKYDHGSEEIDAKYRSKRAKRSIEGNSNIPYALALIKKSELPNLTGEKLLAHLDELIKKSQVYLPDDDDDENDSKMERRNDPSETIYGKSNGFRKSEKYPYYNLPDTDTLNTMSAFRYSENMKNFPNTKQSLYESKNLDECKDIDDDVDPVPKDIEVKGKHTTYNDKPKRLKNLGGKINCFKTKMFGKDPFDNPLFKEEYVAASIPIPHKTSTNILHQVNPLIAVYDDVISNIRASFAEEIKKQREKEIDQASAAETNRVERATTKPDIKIYNLSSAPGVARLPMFDINNFLPKFKAPINDDDDDIIVKTKSSNRNNNTPKDFEMDFVEANSPPKYTKFSTRDVMKMPDASIINLRPPAQLQTSSTTNKYKRRIPPQIQVTIKRIHPTTSSKIQRITNFLQPPTTLITNNHNNNRFKLL